MNQDRAEQKIIQQVERLRDDIIDFTCRLVAEPSTLGHETSALNLMQNELQQLSWSPVKVAMNTDDLASHPRFAPVPWSCADKFNVVAVRRADGEKGQSALFNGHLDVVDPEPASFWQTDPFDPQIREGRIYGRGAGDMKSGVAAMTYALSAVERAGFGLSAPVTIQAVVEEECSGNGTLACLHAGYDADAVLIPEPFGPTLLTDQVGVLWFALKVKGKPVHVLEAPAGTNAIEKCYPIIQALRRLETRLNQDKVPERYRSIAHPLNLNIGIFKGGNWPSTVPAQAEFHGRLSFFPGVSYAHTCRQIKATIDAATKRDPWLSKNPPQLWFYGFRSEGHSIGGDLPLLKMLSQCHQRLSGEAARPLTATCTTDLSAFVFYGKGQATCFGPSGGNFHGANEWVDIESVVHTAKVYALFLARWCRLVE